MTYDCREAAAALESFVVQPRDCNLTSYHESFPDRTFNSTLGKRWISRLTFCEPPVFGFGGGFRGGFQFDEPLSGHEIIWNALSSLPSLLIISPETPWSISRASTSCISAATWQFFIFPTTTNVGLQHACAGLSVRCRAPDEQLQLWIYSPAR